MEVKRRDIIKKIIIIAFTLVIVLIAYGIYQYYPYMAIKSEETIKIYKAFNDNLAKLESVMDDIATGDNKSGYTRWNKIKNRSGIDEILLYKYDYLIQNINACHMYATDNGDKLTYANYIKRFENFDKISKKTFEKTIEGYEINNSCLNLFIEDSYDTRELDEPIKNSIIKINDYYRKIERRKYNNYYSILDNENKKIELLVNLANAIKEINQK